MKKTLGLLLIIVFLGMFYTNISAKEVDLSYNQIFQYPSIDELSKLSSMDEKYKATNIGADILIKLTDTQLLNAVKDYPYLLDIYMFDTFEKGYEVALSRFDGLRELKYRSLNSTEQLKTAEVFEDITLRSTTISRIKLGNLSNRLLMSTSGTVLTPNGTSVNVIIYGETLTADEKKEHDDYVKTYYSSAILVRSATTNYNCHSYAWYSTSTSNTRWMPNPSAYMTDGSYVQRSTFGNIYIGDKVSYGSSDHSGIVYNKGSLNYNNLWITSKWGSSGLVRHLITNSPYSTGSNFSNISFWYR